MFYKAVEHERYFSRHRRYSEGDWSTLAAAVDAFGVRIDEWYFEPIRDMRKSTGHHAFGAMIIVCTLVDALSQFDSKAGGFINYLEQRFPKEYRAKLNTPIRHVDPERQLDLKKVSEVFYHGLRCGLLHQAHAMPYCGVVPGGPAIEVHEKGETEYAAGGDCPTVVFNPWQIFDDTVKVFETYLKNLKDPSTKYSDLRDRFKKKFTDSFGKDIRSLT
jgi:hypothetical protein